MKRTILVLALTLLLCSAAPARGSLDDADIRIPSPARSLSSSIQGNTVNTPGTANPSSNGVIPLIEDPPSVSMWVSLLALALLRTL
jgi:hypothetical protein